MGQLSYQTIIVIRNGLGANECLLLAFKYTYRATVGGGDNQETLKGGPQDTANMVRKGLAEP